MSFKQSALFIALALAGCSSPADHAPQAQVAAPSTVTPTPPPAAQATAYRFSQDGSKIEFTAAKVTASHDGAFGTFTGNVTVPGADLTHAAVSAEIDVASIHTDIERLNGHLKSPDLLDVAQFPKARFTSTAIVAGGQNGATHTVTGNFELHGQTKSISFPATIRLNNGQVEVTAQFAINRRDFGIVYPGMPDDLIKDDVLIKLNIHARS